MYHRLLLLRTNTEYKVKKGNKKGRGYTFQSGSASEPFTFTFEKSGKVALYFSLANCSISSLVPGSCLPN